MLASSLRLKLPVVRLAPHGGVFLCIVPRMVDSVRVTVFLDWQNVYHHAREAFHSPGDPGLKGQINPADLGEVLTSRVPGGVLSAVRIYRGMPDNAYDPRGYAAARRQQSSWHRDPRVIITNRTLRYPDNYAHGKTPIREVKEKGIDVFLALDVVTMATDDAYDLGIVMSCDQDLAPAVERVISRRASRGGGPEVAVASWKSPNGRSPRMNARQGPRVFCHWLNQQDYWGVMDERNYGKPSPADVGPRR